MSRPIGFFKEEPVEEKEISSTEKQRDQLRSLLLEARMISLFVDRENFVRIVRNKIFEHKLETASVTLLAEIVYNMED